MPADGRRTRESSDALPDAAPLMSLIFARAPSPPPPPGLTAASGAPTSHGAAPAANEPPDDVLVERLRGGETAAGEVLVRRYFQPLMRYLQRLTGNDHVAEELHQQTWLSVLDHLEKFDPRTVGAIGSGGGGGGGGGGAFKAWLFRIATNKANDLWRSRGRERSATEGLRLVLEQEAPWAGHRIEGNEQEQKLLAAIQHLPENQRQVLLLRYYSDMKFTEIAEMLGC